MPAVLDRVNAHIEAQDSKIAKLSETLKATKDAYAAEVKALREQIKALRAELKDAKAAKAAKKKIEIE